MAVCIPYHLLKTILRFDLIFFSALKSIWQSDTQKYDGGLDMIFSEDMLTIPLYKPEISAYKHLARVCPAGLHLITIAALFHAVFEYSWRTLKNVV